MPGDVVVYKLVLMKEHNGEVIAHRTFRLGFDGIGDDGTFTNHEEYLVGTKAREMYRDAAFAAGKWPTPDETEHLRNQILSL